MFISCSAQKEILDIPEQGTAIIGGSWDIERGECNVPLLIKWVEGKIISLQVITKEQRNACFAHNSRVYHWENFMLCPGFIDAHVHLALDSIDFFQCLDNWQNPSLIEEQIQNYLRYYLEWGVTVIRDGSDLPGFAWLAKQRVQERQWLGPQIVAVREGVARKGMYGRFLGRGFESLEQWRQAEADFYAQGADQLKVIVTGIISFKHYGQVGAVQWTVEELQELVESAHRRGLLVMAHASGVDGISMAIEAGVDSIEHGYYMTAGHLEKMKEKDIAWVPTVAPIGNLLKYPSGRYSEQEIANLHRILQGQLMHIKKGYELGVRLGIGTDAGAYQVPHGKSLIDELMWFRQAGLSWLDILRIATLENGRICGFTSYGRIAPGTPLTQLQLADIQSIKSNYYKV